MIDPALGSARLEVMSERFPDDLGDRDSFIFCTACETFLELRIEPDGLDR